MDYLHQAIKQVMENYMQNYQPADLVYGTWGASSVKIDGKPTNVPMDMIDVPKGLTVTIGERVTMMQKQGGQKYAVIGLLG